MKNPNNLNCSIRHAKLLTQAGFFLHKGWMGLNKNNPAPPNTSVARLVYWTNKEDIVITFFDNEDVTLKTLVEKIIAKTRYQMKKAARVTFY